jgi:hypothetical protein
MSRGGKAGSGLRHIRRSGRAAAGKRPERARFASFAPPGSLRYMKKALATTAKAVSQLSH